MSHTILLKNKLRAVLCVLALAAALSGARLPVSAQHEGHEGMQMSTPKPARKRAPRRARPAPKRAPQKSTRRAASSRRAGGQGRAAPTNKQKEEQMMMPGMDHTGHQDRQATPTQTQPDSSPAGQTHQHRMQPSEGMQMPAPSPQTKPAGEMQGHEGHDMGQPAPPVSTMDSMRQPSPAATPGDAHTGHRMPGMQMPGMDVPNMKTADAENRQPEMSGPVMSLEDFERMALERNPTLAQAEAAIRAAEGRGRQAGQFPNPVIGYAGEEIVFRAPGETSEHGFFVEQTIPLGGKLGKSRRIFAREKDQAQAVAAAQKQRVLNSIRVLYYDALGAQRLVELRIDLARLSNQAVGITKELFNVGQADRPDQLEIEIEAQRAEIDVLRAENERDAVWRELAVMVNNPELKPARLAGNLEEAASALDADDILATLLRDSPEIKVAQAKVERARAVLARARAEPIPDLFVRGGIAYNNEQLEQDRRKKGTEGRIEVGVSVPIFNRNQGGIAAAEAELAISEKEVERLQLILRSRLGTGFREYRNAQQTVERYRTQIIPRARTAYEMYLSNFGQMAASYPQVLIAQRTLFQVEVEYARALSSLRRSVVGLRGFMLMGGLDAVGMSGERTEGFTLRSANDATGDSDNR